MQAEQEAVKTYETAKAEGKTADLPVVVVFETCGGLWAWNYRRELYILQLPRVLNGVDEVDSYTYIASTVNFRLIVDTL